MKSVFGLLIRSKVPHFSFSSSDETYEENVLEKQADLIRYLRERNEHLSRLALRYKHALDSPNRSGHPHHHL